MAVLLRDAALGHESAEGFSPPVDLEPCARLLGPAGEPWVADPVAAAQRLESMVTISGDPLFPHVNARFVAEDEGYLTRADRGRRIRRRRRPAGRSALLKGIWH